MSLVITIDGPAASGKTSVSRELANRLSCHWVSTGAFYRGLAYVAGQLNVDLKDEAKLAELALSGDWRVQMDDLQTKVFFHSEDVTEYLKREEVGTIASKISSLPEVRKALLWPQRMCARNVSVLVAEGRDCGSVVFPDAQLKVYLTARSEDRAQRRAQETGDAVDKILGAQVKRDSQDQSRKIAPLQIPAGAKVIDTGPLSLREVVDTIEGWVNELQSRF